MMNESSQKLIKTLDIKAPACQQTGLILLKERGWANVNKNTSA